MKISIGQKNRFFRQWSAIVSANGWDRAEAEAQRHALLQRAGFSSLTLVDRVAGFTAVLTQLAIMRNDVGALLHAEGNPRRVLLHKIETFARKLSTSRVESAPFGSAYLGALMIDRFGHMDPERLSDDDLVKLRDTLADRLVQEHRPDTLAHRRAVNRRRRQNARPQSEPRLHFPDLPAAPAPAAPVRELDPENVPF